MSRSNCVHVNTIGDYTKEDILKKTRESSCDTCSAECPNLWICLHYDCLYVGCGEQAEDHSTQHFKTEPEHCLTLNLTTMRLWCYICECEVFLGNNCPPVSSTACRRFPGKNVSIASADPDTDDDILEEDHCLKPRGLTGLQNIGNSCYMNSAIQALSNCPPLTHFFLDCSAVVHFQGGRVVAGSSSSTEKKPGLSKTYLKLMLEMWHRRRPSYLVPSGIAYGIKAVCPMFRGYTQQDSQEFLRCFMDQLHEELKQPCPTDTSPTTPSGVLLHPQLQHVLPGADSSPSAVSSASSSSSTSSCCMDIDPDSESSQSEYETCDSGLSSEKSSCCDEPCAGNKFSSRRKSAIGAGGSREKPRRASSSLENGYHSLSRGSENGHHHPRPYDAIEERVVFPREGNSLISHRSIASLPIFANSTGLKTTRVRSVSASVPQLRSPRSSTSSSGRGGSTAAHVNQIMNVSLKAGRRKRQPKYRSIISDVFDGKILSSVQCLTCDRVSSTKETFQDLSLPIPSRECVNVLHASQSNPQQQQQQQQQQQPHQKGPLSTCTDVYSNQGWFSWMFSWMKSLFWGPTVSLHDCLSAFFSADDLKGDNMYSCEKCKKLRNGIKYSKVLELPEILCVHLKRFRHEVMFSAKLGTYVSFPLEGLDMQPFLHKDCPSSVTLYDLVAVICHHGTAGGGHYTAYALNCVNDQWYEFDDQYVTEVDPQLVSNSEAYVLFYRKTSDEMLKKRQRAAELMEISKCEPSLMQFYISKQWVNKFNTFAEPGPIDNTDFLCPHGGVHPSKVGYAEQLCTILSQGVWEYLYHSFGGGPTCTHLYLCATCHQEMDAVEGRRKRELEEFIRLHEEFRIRESSSVYIYVVAMSWFRTWENFVKGKEDEPPGPVDNTVVAINRNGQFVLRPGSDYAQVSEEIWSFFHGIYGGGPMLTIRQGGVVSAATSTSAGGDSGIVSAVGSSNGSFAASTVGIHNGTSSTPTRPSVPPPPPPPPPPPSPLTRLPSKLSNGFRHESGDASKMDVESEPLRELETAIAESDDVETDGETVRFIQSSAKTESVVSLMNGIETT